MSGLLWNYYTNEPTDPKTDSESFYLRRDKKDVENAIPLNIEVIFGTDAAKKYF